MSTTSSLTNLKGCEDHISYLQSKEIHADETGSISCCKSEAKIHLVTGSTPKWIHTHTRAHTHARTQISN